MFGRIRPEFQYLEGLRQNSNIWKDKFAISNVSNVSNLSKEEKRIAVFERIRPQFQCLEG